MFSTQSRGQTTGAGFLTLSNTKEDLLLNVLALSFVLHIDNTLYEACVSVSMQTGLHKLNQKPIPYKLGSCSRMLWNSIHFIFPVVVSAAAIMAVGYLPYSCDGAIGDA
eukprot:m.85372 g.85372  ORF g.85372 m.85372 type:complete len:109 (+) comp13006_c0_seq2:932-1258(+)